MWDRFESILLDAKFIPLHLSLPFVSTDRRMHLLRKANNRIRLRKRKLNKKAKVLLVTLCWPAIAPLQALAATRRFRDSVALREGGSLFGHFLASAGYALLHFQPAQEYFKYRLNQKANRRIADQFLHHHEIIQLLPELSDGEARKPLSDKFLFHENCIRNGIATAPVIGLITQNSIRWVDSHSLESIDSDLIVKPHGAFCGIGVTRFDYCGDGVFEGPDGESIGRRELEKRLCVLAGGQGDYLIQPVLRNHPEMRRFSMGGLCTIRVVTVLTEDGPRPLIAALRMPRGQSVTDNFAGGGYAAPVDLETGVLGEVVTRNLDYIGDLHPDTGMGVRGAALPFWPEVIRMCCEAQAKFSACPSVGWDAALTESGPVLIEGNEIWGVEILQMTHNRPLGKTLFPDFLLTRLEKGRLIED